jgi:hypothetical protein
LQVIYVVEVDISEEDLPFIHAIATVALATTDIN